MPKGSSQKTSAPAPRAVPVQDSEATETADHEYALVSVLYHALQGAQACEQYVQDANQAGDEDLATFFQECVDEQQGRATRAKQLLIGTLDEDEEDEEDEEDDD